MGGLGSCSRSEGANSEGTQMSKFDFLSGEEMPEPKPQIDAQLEAHSSQQQGTSATTRALGSHGAGSMVALMEAG